MSFFGDDEVDEALRSTFKPQPAQIATAVPTTFRERFAETMERRAMNIVRVHSQPLIMEPPLDAEEYEYRLLGAEPDIRLFNGATEEKTAPNYSDFLLAHS